MPTVGDRRHKELRVGLQRQMWGEGVRRPQRRAHAARFLGCENVGARHRDIGRHRGQLDLPDGPRAFVVGEVQLPVELRQRPEDQRRAQLVDALEARVVAPLGPGELQLHRLARVGGDVAVPVGQRLPLDGGAVVQLAVVDVGRESVEAHVVEPEGFSGVRPLDEGIAAEAVAQAVVVHLA